jgi:hypothetical protein
MVEAATLSFDVDKIENSEYKLARFNQSPDSNEGVKQGLSNAKFVAAEGNTDPYGYYVDAGRVIKWIKAPEGEKKLTVDVVSKGDKQLKNKSFDITPENISKGGVKKLALAFASVMDTASFKGAVRAGQGKDITDEQIDSFLSFLLEGEAATNPEGESEQAPSSPEQEPGESKVSEKEPVYYLSGVGGIKLSVKPGVFEPPFQNHVNLLSIPVDRLDSNQAAIMAADTVDISQLVEDSKALRGIRVTTRKYPDPPEGSGLSVLAINLTNTNLSDKTSAAWRNGKLEIDGPGFNNYYVTGLKKEGGFIVPENPIKLKDEKKQS